MKESTKRYLHYAAAAVLGLALIALVCIDGPVRELIEKIGAVG